MEDHVDQDIRLTARRCVRPRKVNASCK